MRDPVFVVDRDYRIKFMNEAATKALSVVDVKPEVTCHLLTRGKERPCWEEGIRCAVREVFESGLSVNLWHPFSRNAVGSPLREIIAYPVLDDQGQVAAVIKMEKEIVRAELLKHLEASEQGLRQEKERLEAAQREQTCKHQELSRLFSQVEKAKREWEATMDCIPDMVILVNEHEQIRRFNLALTNFVNRPFVEIIGKHWKNFLLANGMRECGFFGNDVEFRHEPSGRCFTVRVHAASSDKLDVAGAVVTLHEITEHKRLHDELEKTNQEIDASRQQLTQALDQISALIQRVAVEQTFGVYYEHPGLQSCWEEMGCNSRECVCYGKESMRCWHAVGTLCGGEVQGEFATKLSSCLNCQHYLNETVDPIVQIGEQFNNMMFILETKNRELGDAYNELKLTQAKILQQEKMASIGLLAAGVAHEINNPIGFVNSNLGTLRKYVARLGEFIEVQAGFVAELGTAKTREEHAEARKKFKVDYVLQDVVDLVEESLEGVERVRKIVANLKTFSRVDQADKKASDLNECLDSTINIVWNELKYKVDLKREYGELPLTVCYPQQLNQVFMNLLMNASQAIAEHGEITVRTWHEGGAVHVAITDTGGGIAAENLPRLFEPFFTTKEVGKGTGLGLSIAYDIVTKQHQGEISVRSEVGKGTTFLVSIPVIEEGGEDA
jgi:signal transduction histidine kinase/PAS domain-containing protein